MPDQKEGPPSCGGPSHTECEADASNSTASIFLRDIKIQVLGSTTFEKLGSNLIAAEPAKHSPPQGKGVSSPFPDIHEHAPGELPGVQVN
ncbi:hypothetical protein JL100_034370 (plasmid) [Skermanella mucosa]|uniref:hypothetical protein n=1 Tax=Skermanella mucosa TaxID=1789672 RepID=UPI00192C0C6A|nr:hypothetical protein [Skermanella mucosa]UEM24827.1 hypothetical protein JL100_034370 [Skermanella mucosa]